MLCAEAAVSAEEGRQPSESFSVQASGCSASASSSSPVLVETRVHLPPSSGSPAMQSSALEQVPGADSSCGSCSNATSRCSTAASGSAPGLPLPEQQEAAGHKAPPDEGSTEGAPCEAVSSLHRQSNPGCPGLTAMRGGGSPELGGPPATVAGRVSTNRPRLLSSGSLDSSRCDYSIQAAAGAQASSAAQAAQRPSALQHGGVGHICDAASSMSEQHGSRGQALSAAMQSLHMPTARLQPAAAFHVRRHLLARSLEGRRIDMVTITGPEEPGTAIADRPVRILLLPGHPCMPSKHVMQGKGALLGLLPSLQIFESACCVACLDESFHSCLG